MRYLVLSDIHANLEALETVLQAARDIPHDRVLVLGDLVGYGADPNAVVERVRSLAPAAVIRGNHDKVGAGLEPADAFNAVARSAIRWTYEALSDDNRDWLADLQPGPIIIDDGFVICHGTPYDEDAYVFDESDVLRAMQAASHRLCLFGHTHVQVGYRLADSNLTLESESALRPLQIPIAGGHYLINPGSVGQPRDGDPRAGFAVYDDQTSIVEIYRTPYPVGKAQAKIREAGLPEALAQRLAIGR
jgi:diadenosine tetraphosphatase ApaH/serine/threonine PP2A family protein phosphatase